MFRFTIQSFALAILLLLAPCLASAEDPPSFIRKWGSTGTGAGQFQDPKAIAVDVSGNVYVCDSGNFRIQKFDNDGHFLLQWGSEGTGLGQFQSPMGVAVDGAGLVYVADALARRVEVFTSSGTWRGSVPVDLVAFHMDVDDAGSFVAVAASLRYIATSSTAGSGLASWQVTDASDFSVIGGIAIGTDGRVHVAVTGDGKIEQFTASGASIARWDFYGPGGIDLDGLGNVYVTSGSSVAKLATDGQLF